MMHNFIGFISVKIETRGKARLETDGNNEACCLRLLSPSAIAHTPRVQRVEVMQSEYRIMNMTVYAAQIEKLETVLPALRTHFYYFV